MQALILCMAAMACPMMSAQNAGTLPATNQTVTVLQHIIFMLQENRGLDHYFGGLRQYWRDNKFSDISFDGLPQFNPTSGAAPL